MIKIGVSKKEPALFEALKKEKYVKHAKEFDNFIEITSLNGGEAIPRVVELAKRLDIRIDYVNLKRPTLEDVFISLTGKEIRDEEATGPSAMFRRMGGVRR